jgi:2,3-bisphosphoglycerate-independent phosphoglycerate mutase
MRKAVLFIIDGLGDLPTPKTPLQASKTPNLDRLAKKGVTGMLSPLGRGVVPGSDTSHLELLGYDPRVYYCGRGPLEALGIGMELEEGDVAMRANLATEKDGYIIDRRAGRIDTKSAAELTKDFSMEIDGVEAVLKNSVEHRGALVLRGSGLSPMVSSTDSHKDDPAALCRPLDDSKEAKKTARIVNEFVKRAEGVLRNHPLNKKRAEDGLHPANTVLLRGAGTYRDIPTIMDRFDINSACVAGGALYRGVAKYLGMDLFMIAGDTGDKNADLGAKVQAVVKALEEYDYILLHVKACDSFGHDGDFEGKKKMLEKIDKEVVKPLEATGADIVITGDHSTPVKWKNHSGHEVPILFYGENERYDKVKKFDEISCMDGGLGHLEGKDIMPMILNMLKKSRKYGS